MSIERIETFRNREESRVEYSHALLWGIFPTQGWNLCLTSPALTGGFFTTSGTLEALLKNVLCLVVQSCRLFAAPWTVAHQAPLSMGIIQARNTGEGCHALFQGIFPT